MKILLAIDESPFSKRAVETVIGQFRPRNAQVLVLHVVIPVNMIVPPDLALGAPTDWDALRKRQMQIARRMVGRAKQKLSAAGFRAESSVVEGNPRTEIVDRAAAWHADLIVLGSHGLTGLSRLLLGSVSESVVRHAPCSVQVVRMPPTEES